LSCYQLFSAICRLRLIVVALFKYDHYELAGPIKSTSTMNRVVIAEDETLLVDALTEVFEEEGFQVTAFNTADEAWRYLSAQPAPPDLLFTDVKMPGSMDGLALAAAFSRQWPSVPVVISSGHIQATDALQTRAVFLAKPWTLDRLIQLCRNVCRKAN
jgi:DNA-binding NtrC family response regulator